MSRNRLAAAAAATIGTLSIVYAIGYLVITPSVQRGADVAAAYRSYLAHPAGPRIAALCLLLSGVLTTVVYAGLHAVPGKLPASWRTWALALGTVSGVATSVHGLVSLIDNDKLAHAYTDGDAAARAAVVVARTTTSAADPRGLATFALVGIVVLAFSRHLRETSPKLAVLGYVAGTDLLLLFLASASGAAVPILVTGGLASLVLGPAWWFGVARRLVRSDGTGVSDRAPAATAAR